MSLILQIEDEGLHERLAIPLVSIPFTKIFSRNKANKLELVTGWKSNEVIPRLLRALRLFVTKYDVDSFFVDDLNRYFKDATNEADKDVSFLMLDPPHLPASFAIIAKLANAANAAHATASVGDEYALPASICLNVRFDGESGRIVRTNLLMVQPSHSSSMLVAPSPASNPSSLLCSKKDDDSQEAKGRFGNDSGDARRRAAFLLYRGLDPQTPLNAVPTPRGIHPSAFIDFENPHDVPTLAAASPVGGDDSHHSDSSSHQSDNNHAHRGGHAGDPAWHSSRRQGFRYAQGRDALLAARGPLRPVQGVTWTHFYQDPAADELVVNDETGLIAPWYASRPDYGRVLNFPVPNEVRFMDGALFLSGFHSAFDIKNSRYFMGNFPVYTPGGSSFTSWHCRVVTYCHPWGIFIPPLQTLRDNDVLGIWFPRLPPWVQHDTLNVFDGLLAICLKSKHTGLTADLHLARIVQLHEGGYQALYDLAVHAGHPVLQTYPTTPSEPQQAADCCLADHILHWVTYVHDMALRGTHLSDRYFLEQFGRSLHGYLRPTFGPFLEQESNRFRVGDALPHSFAPHRLLAKISQRANFLRRPKLVAESPRANMSSSQAIRALTESTDSLFVAALSQPGDRACFLCASTSHLAPECPRFKAIKDNDFARRSLARLLASTDAGAPSPSPHSPHQVRMLESGSVAPSSECAAAETGEDDDLHVDTPDADPDFR
jgi:hypothetical protein